MLIVFAPHSDDALQLRREIVSCQLGVQRCCTLHTENHCSQAHTSNTSGVGDIGILLVASF